MKPAVFFLFASANYVFAASALNVNMRIFEDTLWLGTFLLMFVMGLLMQGISGRLTRLGFRLVAVAATAGFCWKALSTLNRALLVEQPEWLVEVTRESFEAAVGIVLTVAFLVLVYAFAKLFAVSRLTDSQADRTGRITGSPSQAELETP